jgi:endoglucanase
VRVTPRAEVLPGGHGVFDLPKEEISVPVFTRSTLPLGALLATLIGCGSATGDSTTRPALDAGSGVESGSDLDARSGVESGSDLDARSGVDGSDLDARSGADSGSDLDAGSGVESGSDRDAGSGSDAGLGSGPDGSGAETGSASDGGPPGEPASTFHGGNWADPRDNFVNGNLQLSGLSSTTDTYATVTAKANAILAGFQSTAGLNSVRVPINEPTVLGSWWPAYKGIIDSAVGRGMRVLVAYWAWHNAKPDDITTFYSMWKTVVDEYAGNNLVYFEIFNEPYSYTPSAFIDLAVQWMSTYPTVPKGRVIVAGSYSDGTVTQQGADSRLNGTLLALHIYPFNAPTQTSTQAWEKMLQTNVGSYGSRTIVTEWGAPMTTGTNYGGAGDGDNNASFMTGISTYLHDNNMGSCYWPILRNGDMWSLTTLNGTGTALSLSVTNASGLARVESAFGL